MNRDEQQCTAATLYRVCALSWVVFVTIELLRPTTVTRLFSPHLFLVACFAGVLWYYFSRKAQS